MISVTIATCGRASMLRNALESVRRQTAGASISQVIVSENSADDQSRTVCAEFSELPITYSLRHPPVSALQHYTHILPLIKCPLVAILHDDDWWDTRHLETSLRILDGGHDCVAVYSGFFDSLGPELPSRYSWRRDWRIWLASQQDWMSPYVMLDDTSVFMLSLLEFHFHYSSLVATREAFTEAYLRIRDSGNTFDNDRQFPKYLTKHGQLAYVTRPLVFVRLHGDQDSTHQIAQQNRNSLVVKTTRLLRNEFEAKVPMAAARLEQGFRKLVSSERGRESEALRWNVADAFRSIEEPQRTVLVRECGFKLPEWFAEYGVGLSNHKGGVKYFLAQLCPPAIVTLRRRLKKRG